MQINRIINCETAALNRSIEAAQRQLADIKFLRKRKIQVKDFLEEAMEIRLKFPEATVTELAKKIFITREALLHRFKKIHQLAEKIKQDEKN